jgi:hypothetical protein
LALAPVYSMYLKSGLPSEMAILALSPPPSNQFRSPWQQPASLKLDIDPVSMVCPILVKLFVVFCEAAVF